MGAKPWGRDPRSGDQHRWKSAGHRRRKQSSPRLGGGQRRRRASTRAGGLCGPVKSVAFSLDNAHLASGTANNLVIVHDIKTGIVEQLDATHTGASRRWAAAGETGKLFVVSSADKSISTFSLVFEKQIAGHGGR